MRLRRSLLVLAAATIVPVLGFALLAAALVVRQQNDDLRDVAKTRNRATLTAVDAELGQKADLAQTHAAGFDGHLTKPAAPDAVISLAAGATDNVIPLRADSLAALTVPLTARSGHRDVPSVGSSEQPLAATRRGTIRRSPVSSE